MSGTAWGTKIWMGEQGVGEGLHSVWLFLKMLQVPICDFCTVNDF